MSKDKIPRSWLAAAEYWAQKQLSSDTHAADKLKVETACALYDFGPEPDRFDLCYRSFMYGYLAGLRETNFKSEIEKWFKQLSRQLVFDEQVVDELERCKNNRTQTAKALGISRQQLLKRIDEIKNVQFPWLKDLADRISSLEDVDAEEC